MVDISTILGIGSVFFIIGFVVGASWFGSKLSKAEQENTRLQSLNRELIERNSGDNDATK